MTSRPLITFVLLGSTALLASCTTGLSCGNSHPYAAYTARAPLTAPPGVTVPAPDPAYQVPAGGSKTTGASAGTTPQAQPCLVTPPQVLTSTDLRHAAPAPAASTASNPQPSPAPAATTH